MTGQRVWATRIENRQDPPGKGKLIHIELSYATGESPTEQQYQTLADLCIRANRMTCRNLVIVPHIEVDRGIPNGHKNPENFDYTHFHEILGQKGVNMDEIEKFDHDRYWGNPPYTEPWAIGAPFPLSAQEAGASYSYTGRPSEDQVEIADIRSGQTFALPRDAVETFTCGMPAPLSSDAIIAAITTQSATLHCAGHEPFSM